jgi:taurine dioxygenase
MDRDRPDPDAATAGERAGLVVARLGPYLGAEISGVDLGRELTQSQVEILSQALAEHELLVFRDQAIPADALVAFGQHFGELTVHPFAPSDGSAPMLITFRNDEKTPPFATDVWHSDETFRRHPPMATVLLAREVPVLGGDTVFASMSAAYDGLSDRLQQLISGLEAVHDIKPFRALFGASDVDRRKLQEFELRFPPQLHPVVRIHPVSGRKVLFVNPQFTIAINGMDERESRALLDILFQQAQVPEYQYRLQWRPNTIAMWDNRSVQHYAVHDYYPQRRHMDRVTIAGGPVTGLPAADPGTIRRPKFTAPLAADRYGGHTVR